jgi:hypothetical protein
MPCASPSSRHFVAPPAQVCHPLLGIAIVRVALWRVWSALASGDNNRFIVHGHDLGRIRQEIDPCGAFAWLSAVPATPTETSGSYART